MNYLFRDHDTKELLTITDLDTLFDICINDFMTTLTDDVPDVEYEQIVEEFSTYDEKEKIVFLADVYNTETIANPNLREIQEYERLHKKKFFANKG